MENASGDISTELLERPTTDRFSAQGVRAAALVFVDNAGIARMKCVPLDRLQRAAGSCGSDGRKRCAGRSVFR